MPTVYSPPVSTYVPLATITLASTDTEIVFSSIPIIIILYLIYKLQNLVNGFLFDLVCHLEFFYEFYVPYYLYLFQI
jgi:hypothetical protein